MGVQDHKVKKRKERSPGGTFCWSQSRGREEGPGNEKKSSERPGKNSLSARPSSANGATGGRRVRDAGIQVRGGGGPGVPGIEKVNRELFGNRRSTQARKGGTACCVFIQLCYLQPCPGEGKTGWIEIGCRRSSKLRLTGGKKNPSPKRRRSETPPTWVKGVSP